MAKTDYVPWKPGEWRWGPERGPIALGALAKRLLIEAQDVVDGILTATAGDTLRSLSRPLWRTLREVHEYQSRDLRQKAVYRWVLETFGERNATIRERVLRLFEEVVELAQAEGLPIGDLANVLFHVYQKPPGIPGQELGGIGTTLLAYAEAKGLSADSAEEAELKRVLAIDADYFRKRHNKKADAGIAERSPESDK